MKLKVFWTPQCGQCPQQKEIVDDLAADRDDVEVEKINAAEEMQAANQYGVRGVPATVVEDDDGVVEMFNGFAQRADLEAALN